MKPTFKEFLILENVEAELCILQEGKFLDLVKHFMARANEFKKMFSDESSTPPSFENTLRDVRNMINKLPKQYRPEITRMMEYVSKIMIDGVGDNEQLTGKRSETEISHNLADRMMSNSFHANYKNYFKVYVMEFFIESLLMTSVYNESVFDKSMDELKNLFHQIDSIHSSSIMKNIVMIVKMTPRIISVVGNAVKFMTGEHMETNKPQGLQPA